MDQYETIRELGRGSQGEAILIQSKATHELFVAKSVRGGSDPRLLSEAHLLQSLDHPNIIRYVACIQEPKAVWLIMEYADGGDLGDLIANTVAKGEYVAEAEAMRLLIQLTLAVEYLHRKNILHRDIKPHNVFLTADGLVKLGDFGIAKTLDNTLAAAQTQIGTPLSPEICEGNDYNTKSDIWSLGCLVYELLALKSPFHDKTMPLILAKILTSTPEALPTQFSPALRELTMQLLSKEPNIRPDASAILHSSIVQSTMMQFVSCMPRKVPSKPFMRVSSMPQLPPLHSLLDHLHQPPPSTRQQQPTQKDIPLSHDELARQQYLENQRAARQYKERMDKLKNDPPPFATPITSPRHALLGNAIVSLVCRSPEKMLLERTCHSTLTTFDRAISRYNSVDYETMLAQERRRVYVETKALHERMRVMQLSSAAAALE
ncbi:Aste57867_13909 [Aphanomyces stellatus]|uniref:non-specific serine/threonine protein kinase n=1 Tax=Aphanomyces stellatus TaxID=120398 RepID=A0A485L1I9_9STRA|nr:hypothetical protein As57867_013858 [Aphanomyces stellatus]VFT90740.1 Aste57867_13909 [Aphanomyces stellatus]